MWRTSPRSCSDANPSTPRTRSESLSSAPKSGRAYRKAFRSCTPRTSSYHAGTAKCYSRGDTPTYWLRFRVDHLHGPARNSSLSHWPFVIPYQFSRVEVPSRFQRMQFGLRFAGGQLPGLPTGRVGGKLVEPSGGLWCPKSRSWAVELSPFAYWQVRCTIKAVRWSHSHIRE